jgi:hypothetical protein
MSLIVLGNGSPPLRISASVRFPELALAPPSGCCTQPLALPALRGAEFLHGFSAPQHFAPERVGVVISRRRPAQ